MSTLGDEIRELCSNEPSFLDVDAIAEKVEAIQANQYRMAAALNIALNEAHVMYGSTATWHGGIGGAMMTLGCAFKDPSPRQEWMNLAGLTQPIRQLMEMDQEVDIQVETDKMRLEFGG